MDIAWNSICEEIRLSGPHGLTWEKFKSELKERMKLKESQLNWPPGPALKYLLQSYDSIDNFKIGRLKESEKFKKHNSTKLMFYVELELIPLDSFMKAKAEDLPKYYFFCPSQQHRCNSLFQGRPIYLSENSVQCLEVIASYGRNGLTQAELAKVLGCDSKNAFHWLKSLISNDLITRTPVASKKSFTYLLTLTRYFDEEMIVSSSSTTKIDSQTHTVVSSKEIRQQIVDILAKAPNQTMVSKDVFAQTELDSLLIKNFRRAAAKLNEIGWLEYLFEDQLQGPYCRLFRLKRKPSEGLDLKVFFSQIEESKRQEAKEVAGSAAQAHKGYHFRADIPIIHQIILLLTQTYPEPMSTGDLSHALGISRKYIYRLIDRIIPPTGKKSSVVGSEGVGKVSDFVGREKRLKLFIKTEEFRDIYLQMMTSEKGPISDSNQSTRPSTPFTSNASLQSIQLSLQSSPSDTRTRHLRHQALLQELSAHKILELNKELCGRIQNLLGDSRFMLDIKTLKRSVDILEREGKLKVIIATVPSGTRTLLLSPEIDPATSSEVKSYIQKLNETTRTGPLSAASQKLQKLKEEMQQPDFFVDGSLPLGVAPNPSVTAKTLSYFEFVHGIMARAEMFHKFLIESAVDGGIDTLHVVFERMTLQLYLNVIGIVRMSRDLHNQLSQLKSKCLSEIPEAFRDELSFNRKRFQSQISLLLEILEQLNLIVGDENHSSLNFKFPLQYKLAIEVPIYSFDGAVQKLAKFDYVDKVQRNQSFDELWGALRKISVDFHSKSLPTASIYDDDSESIEAFSVNIPKPILLARHADSWKNRPSREKDLEIAIRKLASEALKQFRAAANVGDSLSSLAAEFEVPLQRTEVMFEAAQRLLTSKSEARRLDKAAKRRKLNNSEYDADDDDDDSEADEDEFIEDESIEQYRWAPSDWPKLSLAFCILQQPLFYSPASGIKWQLACQIFDKPKSAIVVRRHGLKLFKNYEELKRLVELDTVVNLIVRSRNPNSGTDLNSTFRSIYNECLEELTKLDVSQSEIYNQFVDADGCCWEQLKPRQEHFLNVIDSWVLSRSFRHGVLLNTPGTIKSAASNVNNEARPDLDPFILKLRQILAHSSRVTFDFESTIEFLKTVDQEVVKRSIDHLLGVGFASKNRSKDRNRLFGFPLAISESTRAIIENDENDAAAAASFDWNNLVVSNSVDPPSMARIDEAITAIMENRLKFEILPADFSNDAADNPIKFLGSSKNYSENPLLNFTALQGHSEFLWYSPLDSEFNSQVASNSLKAVQSAIKASPGISKSSLASNFSNIFTPAEVEALISCLIANQCVQLTDNTFLHLQ